MPHGPRHLATWMERSAHAEMERSAVEGCGLFLKRQLLERCQLSCRSFVIRNEVSIRPLGEVSVNCLRYGEAHTRPRRRIEASESISVERRPLERLERRRVRIAERINHLAPKFL